jgi:hypothetical protein
MSQWIPITVYIVRADSKVECYDKLWRPQVLTCGVEVACQLKLHGFKSSDFIPSFAKAGEPTGVLEPFDEALVLGELAGRAICLSERHVKPGKRTAEDVRKHFTPAGSPPMELNGRRRKRAAEAAAEDAGGFCKLTIPDGRAEDVTDRALLRSRHQERLRREYEACTREVDAIHEECVDVAQREVKTRLKAEELGLSDEKYFQELGKCYELISKQLAKELAELEEARGRAMRRQTDALADAASARAIFKF